MPTLTLKPTHPAVQSYYQAIQELMVTSNRHEGAVATVFATLLRHCARHVKLRLVEQPTLRRGKRIIRPAGVFFDELELHRGLWQTQESWEVLDTEILAKFQQGYPNDNILFHTPERLVIYQGSAVPVFDAQIADSPSNLVAGLKVFFEYQQPAIAEWQQVTNEFQGKLAEEGTQLVNIIKHEYKTNQHFRDAFEKLTNHCQTAINPNLRRTTIEEMLVQQLLTERIFTTVFSNLELVKQNVLAREINQVVKALTSQSLTQTEFIKQHLLGRFYTALEKVTATFDAYTDKQAFLNAVYERFFQGFAVKVADRHGIVYTPQPLVEFMVNSVQEILQRDFKRSLAAPDVQIMDPFVGTGNFMIRILKAIAAQPSLPLEHKYLHELHCNEVMLLPYYIACLNIEHEFYELAGKYLPYDGIRLVDTFELVEETEQYLSVRENTQHVWQQQDPPLLVIISNPPYNVGQQHENDNNKNRRYPVLDQWVTGTYAKDSKATNKNALADVYVKAFAWATWRLQERQEGIVAFVSNNSFLDGIAFDGMRKHLMKNFSKIYHLNLKGNARTSGERRRMEGGNVFNDAIRVGVGITFLVKQKQGPTPPEVWIYAIDDYWNTTQKQAFLTRAGHLFEVPFQLAQVNADGTWLTSGLRADFADFIPLGTKAGKSVTSTGEGVLFKVYSRGVGTSRDAWAHNFDRQALAENMRRTIETYNAQVHGWMAKESTMQWNNATEKRQQLDAWVLYDDQQLSWSHTLKTALKRHQQAQFDEAKIRVSLYRPFTKNCLFFDRLMNNEGAIFRSIFPTIATEKENRVICVNGIGGYKPLSPLMVNCLPDLGLIEATQCFPFYLYAEDGSHRQENLTDWVLDHFQSEYHDLNITKWDIFHYVYGLLHHPVYRSQYAVNLRRELPRIPLLRRPKGTKSQVKKEDFWCLSQAGQHLAELHVNYEHQPEYPLSRVTTPGIKPHYRVDKMRLSKARDTLFYNHTLTLTGIPPAVFQYRLGNRAALEWVLNQYQVTIDGHRGRRDHLEWLTDFQVKTSKGSGILNDPNRRDDEQYILRLIGQVITVSLETVKIVTDLQECVAIEE